MERLKSIYSAVLEGQASATQSEVKAALAEGIPAGTILKDGLIAAMGEVGRLFEAGEYFVPEMLVAARAMQSGLSLLKPHSVDADAQPTVRVIIGTVKGDLHDIGKNLVVMMLEGTGFEMINLGSDVAPDKFVAAVREHMPQILGMSALLTTTMPGMGITLKALEEAGIRDAVKVTVGGAPVTEVFARQNGADGYAADASAAARLAGQLAKV